MPDDRQRAYLIEPGFMDTVGGDPGGNVLDAVPQELPAPVDEPPVFSTPDGEPTTDPPPSPGVGGISLTAQIRAKRKLERSLPPPGTGAGAGELSSWSAVDRNSREYKQAYDSFIRSKYSPAQADASAQAEVENYGKAPADRITAAYIQTRQREAIRDRQDMDRVSRGELERSDQQKLERFRSLQASAVQLLGGEQFIMEQAERKAAEQTRMSSGALYQDRAASLVLPLAEQLLNNKYIGWNNAGRPVNVPGRYKTVHLYFKARAELEANPRLREWITPLGSAVDVE